MSENHPLQGGKDFINPKDKETFQNFKMEVDYEKDAERVNSEFLAKDQDQRDLRDSIRKLSEEERKKIEKNLPPSIPLDSK
ncbi:MAG: hypothetical protein COY69_01805 [Candidatus Magasanikbacteria bacterium CG_4_10_14_0_8_um_filter_32_14]|uniref:Uncharacterized protein n=1 Tax=Candidatus Magasanikbacteria bacterium CG_4_10_14_0_8_um_filter_32_14 TaxID=1974640 RepID=A0A2M7RA12_9BACT|nr:MAG: hypothetical protein COY69_01805 [Candidatus Magasanikbacteria bacterium CG_4_10_14_0_8_um_filter_32_14]